MSGYQCKHCKKLIPASENCRCDGGYWAIVKQPLDVEYECELEWKR